jgi:hypothetical protein
LFFALLAYSLTYAPGFEFPCQFGIQLVAVGRAFLTKANVHRFF